MILYQQGGVTPSFADSLDLYKKSTNRAEAITRSAYVDYLNEAFAGDKIAVQDSLIDRFILPAYEGREGFEDESIAFPGPIQPVGNVSYGYNPEGTVRNFLPFFMRPEGPITPMIPTTVEIEQPEPEEVEVEGTARVSRHFDRERGWYFIKEVGGNRVEISKEEYLDTKNPNYGFQ